MKAFNPSLKGLLSACSTVSVGNRYRTTSLCVMLACRVIWHVACLRNLHA